MRNIPKPLSPEDALTQRLNLNSMGRFLSDPEKTVTVEYIKRNGEKSSSTGTALFINGKPGFDTGSVTIRDHVKGERTINLHRIIRIDG